MAWKQTKTRELLARSWPTTAMNEGAILFASVLFVSSWMSEFVNDTLTTFGELGKELSLNWPQHSDKIKMKIAFWCPAGDPKDTIVEANGSMRLCELFNLFCSISNMGPHEYNRQFNPTPEDYDFSYNEETFDAGDTRTLEEASIRDGARVRTHYLHE